MSGYISYRWPRTNKEVDLKNIVKLVQQRLQEAEQRREEAKGSPDGKDGPISKRSVLASGSGESSNDTESEDKDSTGFNGVVQELE